MRFEVRYPSGAQHEVELSGTVAVLGRDPSCDLVLNDSKCSRRHAVLEAGPQGISIRDAGSANGIYVNGKKVERASLVDGDVIRLGEVVLKVLPEEVPGTLVMAQEDLDDVEGQADAQAPRADSSATAKVRPVAPPRAPAARPPTAPVPVAAPPPIREAVPPPPVERPRTEARPGGPVPRPLTVTVLAALWAAGMLLYPGAGLALVILGGAGWLALAGGGAIGALSALMAYGLWMRAPWARTLQMVLAGLGLLTCAFVPPSAAILIYMLRDEARIHFSGRQDYRQLAPREIELLGRGASEPLFTAGVLVGLAIAFIVAAIGGAIAIPSLMSARRIAGASDAAVVERLRAVASAQRNFAAGTCGAYADLEGLLNPATVIPHYPPTGPAFLGPEFGQPQAATHQFELRAQDPVPPTEGCPGRSFRHYAYAATPLSGQGRHLAVFDDGIVRYAEGRPATPADPPTP